MNIPEWQTCESQDCNHPYSEHIFDSKGGYSCNHEECNCPDFWDRNDEDNLDDRFRWDEMK